MITTQTQLCISLSARPGGFGNCFHNYLYQKLKLNFVYKAGTTSDLKAAIGGVRALGIRGCGLSMPYKVEAMQYLDSLDERAKTIGAVNTIVNEDGHLKGYNTDFTGVVESIRRQKLSPKLKTALLGSGGMARATAFALKHLGFPVTLFSRNPETGKALAQQMGFEWQSQEFLTRGYQFLVNTTSMGMQNSDLAFSESAIDDCEAVMDVVTNFKGTPLTTRAKELGKKVISGFEITVFQGEEQFRLYTGVTLTPNQVAETAEYVSGQLSLV